MSLNTPLVAAVDTKAKVQRDLGLQVGLCPKYISRVRVELFQVYNIDVHVPHFIEWPVYNIF